MKTPNAERRTASAGSGFLILFLLLLLLLGIPAQAETPALTDALRPLQAGVPQVAVVRLRALLEEKELAPAERVTAQAKLGEALLAAGDPAAALEVLANERLRDLPETKFHRAQALAALGRWSEALPLYAERAATPGAKFAEEARFGQAEALRALGRVDEALAVLRIVHQNPRWLVPARLRMVELILQKRDPAMATRAVQSIAPEAMPEKKARRFLRGRVEARRSRDHAIQLYESILKSPSGTTHSVLIATLFAHAEAHLQSRTAAAGDDFLEDFIERHPTDEELPALFAKLDQLYAAQTSPSRQELLRWSNQGAQPRRALAQWYLARSFLRAGRKEGARESFQRLRLSAPRTPILSEAWLEFAQFEMEAGRVTEALAILEEARSLQPPPAVAHRIEMMLGATHRAANSFAAAAETFRQLVEESPPTVANDALYNATIAWLEAEEPAKADATRTELEKRGANDETRGQLRLEEALLAAERGAPTASALLQNFLRDFPKHGRAAEAEVALAELAFHAAPPRLEEARAHLARAVENKPSPAAAERAHYLRIWLESADPATPAERVIGLAQDFLRRYEHSQREAEVRVKLAEIHYARQDFAGAQTQFELLAQKSADPARTERALFFAAKSAMQMMGAESLERALILFGEVVKREGELKWAARNEQAAIERKLGKTQDALTLYDEVLRSAAQPAEKHEALCAKGDIFYELGGREPQNYERAIELYEELAKTAEASADWRNQARFKQGMCLEKLNRPREALATFYAIVENEAEPSRPREFFWYYKAGFNAARLLEEEAKWEPAAAVYEKLAFAGGARSEEARARLNQLRLEHFLWDR